MDLNEFAKEITEHEGGKIQVNIAQVKEVLRVILTLMADMKPSQVLAMIEKYRDEHLTEGGK